MEWLKQHMWLAAALALSLPLSLSAAADGNKPNHTLESVQRTLLNRISELEGKINVLDGKVNTLTTVAAKRGVATLQVVPRASKKAGNGQHYHNPRYFVMGSTIQAGQSHLDPAPTRACGRAGSCRAGSPCRAGRV